MKQFLALFPEFPALLIQDYLTHLSTLMYRDFTEIKDVNATYLLFTDFGIDLIPVLCTHHEKAPDRGIAFK